MLLLSLITVAAVVALVVREASHRRQLDRLRGELRAAKTQAGGGAVGSVGQAVSGLAQELREPLQEVLGSTELLLATSGDGSPSKEDLRQIHETVQRAAGIVRNLTAVTETSSLTCRWQDVNEIIDRVLVGCHSELQDRAIKLERVPSPRLPLVYVDGRQLEKVVAGLVLRGPRSAKALGLPVRVDRPMAVSVKVHRTSAPRDSVVIAIEDDGPAPGSEEQALASEDLGAARHVVAAHGGSLTIGPRLSGTGVQTLIELPVSAAAGTLQEPRQPWTESSISSTSTGIGISTS